MANVIWLTPAGDLGIIPESLYYEKQFDSYNSLGGSVTYKFIAGELPSGLSVSSTGLLSGIPNITPIPKVYTFTIRVSNGINVADRTFSITVANSIIPYMLPPSGPLSNYYITDFVDIQLTVIPSVLGIGKNFTLISGTLPPGLTLTREGRLYGYLQTPTIFTSPYAPGFDAAANPSLNLFASTFDIVGFDYSGTFSDVNYQFSIKAADASSTLVNTYTLFVQAKPSGYNPVLFNTEGSIGQLRQNTNFAYQFIAEDYNSQSLTYNLATGSLPTGLSLNPTTGWLTGYVSNTAVGTGTITANIQSNIVQGVGTQFLVELQDNDTIFVANNALGIVSNIVSNTELTFSNVSTANVIASAYSYTVGLKTVTYPFGVEVYETADPTFTSGVKNYSITVKGDISNTVDWITDADLGTIYNGEISTLSISATTASGLSLNYYITEGSYGALPIGLILLPDGNISGRVSFDLEGNAQSYSFTVEAYDENLFAYGTKTFTVRVIKRDNEPYENLYLQIIPDREQRALYDSIINNSTVFPDDYIYRLNDPWFGKNTLRRVLFMTGLNTESMATYIESMAYNHYWKTLNFGDIKTAKAVDADLNYIYDVVYIELIDNQVNAEGDGPPLSVYLPDSKWSVGPWRTADSTEIIDDSTYYTADISPQGVTIYPNSFPNMVQRVGDGVGYENRSILPAWMTTRQSNGTVLGFTRALILAYVKPGRGKECVFRLNELNPKFNLIDFTIDRYELDRILSDNWILDPIPGSGNIIVSDRSTAVLGSGPNVGLDVDSIIVPVDSSLATIDLTEFYYNSNAAFSSELSTNASIYVGNTLVGYVDTITSNTKLSLTANGAVSAFNTPFEYANQFNKITQAGTGTISANIYSTIVQGTGTLFDNEIHIGDVIYVSNATLGTVSSITSNTQLVLTNVSSANVSSVSYSHTYRDPYTVPGQGDKYLKFPQVGVLS